MKIIYTLLFLLTIVFGASSQSDNCATATIVTLSGGTACVNGTTVGATSDNILYGSCNSASINEVWYTYVASGSQNDFTITSSGLTNAEIIIDVDGCGNGTFETCNTVTGNATLNQAWGIAPGQQVWIGIASNGGVQGSFQLCINSYTGPTGGGNTCSGAIPICSTTPYTVSTMAPFTASGQYPSCFLSAPQQDVFLEFTILTSGTFAWNAVPLCNAEFDWALWNITAGCPGVETQCNYNFASNNSGTFGMVAGPGTCMGESCDPVNVTAGQVYILQIDNYTTSNNCGFTFTYNGTAQITPSTNFTINPNTFTCGSSVSVTINNSSVGVPTWDFGNGSTFTGSTPPAQTYTTPGTYAITATIPGDCPATSAQYVQLYAPLAGNVTNTPTTCPGVNNGTASVSSVTGGNGIYTYSWSPGGATTPTITNLSPGTYTVTITNALCGTTLQLSTTVGVGPAPSFSVIGTNPTSCGGTNGSILLSGLSNNTSYSVTYLNGSTTVGPITYTSSASGTINLSGLSAGNYSGFSITVNPTGCTASISTNISLVEPGAPVLQINNPSPVCSPNTIDLTANSVTVGSTGGGTLTYWSNSAATIPLNNPNTIASSGTYFIQANASGCIDVEAVQVTVNNPPTLIITDPIAVCSPNTIDLTASSITTGSTGVGNLSYWNDLAASSALNNPASVGTTGIYYIQASNNGCNTIDEVTVTINPTPNIVINNPSPVCFPNTVDITANSITSGSSNIGTLSYWVDAMAASALSNPNSINVSNTYYIQAIDNGCSAISPVNVVINPIPSAPSAGVDETYCISWELNPMNATGSGGILTWYSDAALTNSIGTGAAFVPNNNIGTTSYYVTETLQGCESPASVVMITINMCEITIPTAITMDGDGVNDTWEVIDLDAVYPGNIVTIYNRWGGLIYKHDSNTDGPYYLDEWDGKYKDKELPVGTYYYIIDLGYQGELKNGIVSILRE